MDFKIQKLDRRHTGYGTFTHFVTPKNYFLLLEKIHFLEVRKWCWDTFGPGAEREWTVELHQTPTTLPQNKYAWAWHTQDQHKRIYFTEEAYVIFALKWL